CGCCMAIFRRSDELARQGIYLSRDKDVAAPVVYDRDVFRSPRLRRLANDHAGKSLSTFLGLDVGPASGDELLTDSLVLAALRARYR
ncbi:MAG: hypothetical protein Q7R96_05470, partial [Nanoarchaeota archaeon]|nr:hypothetical protein [Nanoarchaeota archaeon]